MPGDRRMPHGLYFGEAAARVRPGRLAMTLGAANLFAGAIWRHAGLPRRRRHDGALQFRRADRGAPIFMGSVLLCLALVFGASLAMLLAGFPLPILAGLLGIAGLLHIALLKDLQGRAHWALAIAVGVTGFLSNLAIALVGALLIWWGVEAFAAYRGDRKPPPLEAKARRSEPRSRSRSYF